MVKISLSIVIYDSSHNVMQFSNTKCRVCCASLITKYTHRGEIIYHVSQVLHDIDIAFQLLCKLLGIK